ncbi:hypothetical protein NIES4106_58220 (plasmid) [Fischerella sp. NIES-4106]|nr:hypothetical protein NIES4106_58220 [Fischerella sp. NIES-4106]
MPDEIPNRTFGFHPLSPLHGLIVSRYRGGYAVTLSPEGEGISPSRISSCLGSDFYLAANPSLFRE